MFRVGEYFPGEQVSVCQIAQHHIPENIIFIIAAMRNSDLMCVFHTSVNSWLSSVQTYGILIQPVKDFSDNLDSYKVVQKQICDGHMFTHYAVVLPAVPIGAIAADVY